MKKILNAILQVIETIGTARAAAYLSRHGHYEQAKALMLAK